MQVNIYVYGSVANIGANNGAVNMGQNKKGLIDMKLDMDKIVFEDRTEIDEIASALDTFLKEHPEAREKESAKKLMNMLDSMYMSW